MWSWAQGNQIYYIWFAQTHPVISSKYRVQKFFAIQNYKQVQVGKRYRNFGYLFQYVVVSLQWVVHREDNQWYPENLLITSC